MMWQRRSSVITAQRPNARPPGGVMRRALFLISAVMATPVAAQTYPAKQIRVIVPFAAGGPTDTVSRAIGQKLTEAWNQPVVIDNRPGAGGNLGTEIAAKSPADGYTLFIGFLFKAVPDPLRDFAPVTQNYITGLILAVHPSLPVKSVKELVALAKARPGALAYASSGVGGTPHMSGELFSALAGVKMVHVPYKGSAPAMAELLGGQVQLTFDNMLTVLPQVKAGKLRGLAVTLPARTALAPELPTIAESGLVGFEVKSWNGVVVPAGVARDTITRLNTEIVRILRDAALRERFMAQGVELAPSTPEEFGAFIRQDIAKWAKVIQVSGARAE